MKWKYRICIIKFYFDKGYSLTAYPKWAFLIGGIKADNLTATIILTIIYPFLCFFLAFVWLKWPPKYETVVKYGYLNWQQMETEIGNYFNPFVGEMRDKIK